MAIGGFFRVVAYVSENGHSALDEMEEELNTQNERLFLKREKGS
jgi:hypothetical protein